jgi:osmotically-inducible protein OsmY
MVSEIVMQQNIIAELRWEPSVNAAEIGVAVKDGVVSLNGTVDTYAQKFAAERAVERVAGVRAIADELKVVVAGSFQRTDADIARAASNALAWDTEVPDGVTVVVQDGWVTLSGKVPWYFQKAAAERAVRYLVGVRGVSDKLEVSHPAKPEITRVKADIEAALRRSAEIDAKQIRVETADTTVTLKGSVRSWAERRDVTRAAWNAPGVRFVNDQLMMTN